LSQPKTRRRRSTKQSAPLQSAGADRESTELALRTTNVVLEPVVAFRAGQRGDREDATTVQSPRSPLPSSRRATLAVLAGPDEGALYKLKPNAVCVVGRAQGAQVRIIDDGVSRKHARVTVRGDQVMLEDLGSRNGTFIGEERIERRRLVSEDLIRIGATTILKFCYIDTLEEDFRRRLLDAALRDPLTGVFNRRYFDERLTAECAAALRHGRALSLLMIDVDDFKLLNDRHGHQVGDAVLQSMANTVKEGLRREDVMFRYGGEEFAILLRETALEGARQLADRLIKKTARMRHHVSEKRGAPGIAITMSIGVAAFSPGMGERDLVQLADAGLYHAKRTGKNRVESAP
jgi:two-component system, cell cycle response regulator